MSSEQDLVLGAVRRKDASKKQSVLQKLFAVWFDAFVYNQIWEDPRVDLEALRLDENSRVLTISSGGCNALNYLLAGPASVTAVDLNRHHIYLLNLKIAALRFLPAYEDFFAFFGYGKSDEAVENYERFISPNLDRETRRFWESSSLLGKLGHGRRINFFRRGGLYEHSRNGYFLRFFHKFARVLGCRPEEVLKAKNAEEQAALYEKYIAPFFDSAVIKTIGKLPVTMFGLGIPPQQYDELKKDLSDGGSLIDVYRERTRRLAVEYPIYENYFAWQAFARKYDTEKFRAVPEYLKAENYEQLKDGSAKISTRIGSVTDEIRENEQGAFNRFVFLDAQDWMNVETLTELWTAISEKSTPGARVIFRTAGAASPIETTLPRELREKFDYQENLSKRLFKQDRASIYGGFHLYVRM
jgi:S-adenosylmethionine-diacylglycerol 3-amino-3-carboxypropyl transferase